MSDESAAETPEAESPPSAPSDESAAQTPEAESPPSAPLASWPPRRSLMRSSQNYYPAVVLVIAGLFVTLAGFLQYPKSTTGVSTPFSAALTVVTALPMSTITYSVHQYPAMAKVTIEADMLARPPGAARPTTLNVDLPYGVNFSDCHSEACKTTNGFETWTGPLTFRSTHGSGWAASVTFAVESSSFGISTNGLVASVALPSVTYLISQSTSGAVQPIFLAKYGIASANSYTWSGYPAAGAGTDTAVWKEQLINGETAGQMVDGNNSSSQARVTVATFYAGILFGLGGGLTVAAVQEAVHVGRRLPYGFSRRRRDSHLRRWWRARRESNSRPSDP
jgi:hypothetical protein